MGGLWGGGNLYGHLITQRFFTLTMNGVFMQTPKIMKNLATLQIEFANRLALIVCLVSMKQFGNGNTQCNDEESFANILIDEIDHDNVISL